MSFWTKQRRRNVFEVGTGYALVAWILVQVVGNVFRVLDLPEWTGTFVVVLLSLGFPLAHGDACAAVRSRTVTPVPPSARAGAAITRTDLPNSIGVLPSANLSPNADDAYRYADTDKSIPAR